MVWVFGRTSRAYRERSAFLCRKNLISCIFSQKNQFSCKITSSTTSNLNDVSTLLAESNTFSDTERNKYSDQIIKLNKHVIKTTLAEFKNSYKHIKNLENNVSDEVYLQLLNNSQSQHIQILLKLKELESQFNNKFTSEISDVSIKIANLGNLINSYKNNLIITDLKKHNEQRLRFISWAKEQLGNAKMYDNEGEIIANKWTKTRTNEEAINKYVQAWQTLMSIHPGDLQTADPALFQSYSELKGKIENHWHPNDYQRGIVKYKRISDF